jgi:peroxiredoxin
MKKIILKGALLPFMLLLMSFCTSTEKTEDYTSNLLKVGTEAPSFALNTPQGETIKLEDLKLKGDYIVLDFWASWCPDCRKDVPNVLKAYNTFKDKGVTFVGISFDTDKEVWTKAIEQYAIPYIQVSELKKWKETSISSAYHIQWIPTLYLLDKEGKVLFATVYSDELINKLEEITK